MKEVIKLSEIRGEKGVRAQTVRRIRRLTGMEDASRQRATLAQLRRGVGRRPGDDPALWSILFEDLPEEMLSRTGEPTREEWAIHTALTLFALHQQGLDPGRETMQVEGRSLGRAAALLVVAQSNDPQHEEARGRIARRFNQAATASSIEELAHYLRELIVLLRGAGIGLDYPMLAADLYGYQYQDRANGVRLRWGQDFYRKTEEDERND